MNIHPFRKHLYFICCILLTCPWFVNAEPWGNDPRHNMVHHGVSNVPGNLDEATLVWSLDKNWKHQYPMPTQVDDLILVGGDASLIEMEYWQEAHHRGGTFTAFRLEDAKPVWQLIVPNPNYGHGTYGICTTPLVQGDRIYLFAMDEILCLDLKGLSNGNQGYQDELAFMTEEGFENPDGEEVPTELPDWSADILWRHSLKPYSFSYQDATSCSMIEVDGYLWISTSHQEGTEAQGWHVARGEPELQPPYEKKPFLMVLNKENGQLVAVDDMEIPNIFHGMWSSPSLVTREDGQRLVVFPDGYGVVHGFEVPDFSKIDDVVKMKPLWDFDVNLPEWRKNAEGKEWPYTQDRRLFFKFSEGFPTDPDRWVQGYTQNSTRYWGPSEIIGMPAVVGNRVVVAVGRDGYYNSTHRPEGEEIDLPQGGRRYTGPGRMVCLEIGPDLQPTLVWENRKVFRTQCTPSIYDGMVFLADTAGMLHCIDAATGDHMWRYDLGYYVECRSQIVADGKVFVSSSNGIFHILKASREMEPIYETRFRGHQATPETFDGHLLISGTMGMKLYRAKDNDQAHGEHPLQTP